MDFRSAEEHLLLQHSLRDFLAGEFPPAKLRALWAGEAQRGGALWAALAELGVCGMLIAEEHGGLGLDMVAAASILEEAGRAALAEPLASASVAAPLLAELGGALAEEWLPQIAAGRAVVAVGHPLFAAVEDADCAQLLLLPGAQFALHAVPRAAVQCQKLPSSDPSRFIAKVTFDSAAHPPLAEGERARKLWDAVLLRGAMACAAQAIGVCEQLLQMSVTYTGERRQFGKAVGSFQALKHKLADVKLKLEYARPLVQRAAHSLAQQAQPAQQPQCGVHVSMAKLWACEAAEFAARQALQCHGAIGYTWEQDLHIWMRRTWSLAQSWGSARFHLSRVREPLLGGAFPIGPATTFATGETT